MQRNKNKMNRRRGFNIFLAVILAGLLVWEVVYSVNNTTFVDRSSAPTVRIAHNPWDTEVASAQVLGIVLEEAGYNVSLVSLDNAIVFESIATGESDITTIAWLPVTHSSLYETYGDQVVDLGYNLEGARSGLAVPSYMDVDSIDELSNEAGSSVMGIEPGAGIMDMTEVAMETYDNLADWKLESPSTGAMLASLADAIANEEEFVFTAWAPHWKFLRYEIKFLDDPELVYGEAENIHTLVRQGFEEDMPDAYRIVDNFYWEVEDMESVTLAMQDGVPDREAAQTWVDNNRDKVEAWLNE